MLQLAFYLGTKRENPQHAQVLDRLICWWTGRWDWSAGGLLPRRIPSRFSHVEFIAKWGWSGTWATCWAASNRDGKVRHAPIDVNSGRWLIVTVPEGDYGRLLAHFQAREGVRYGWLCAAAHILPRPVRGLLRAIGRHLPYCSSIIAAGCGLPDAWIHPQRLYEALTGERA